MTTIKCEDMLSISNGAMLVVWWKEIDWIPSVWTVSGEEIAQRLLLFVTEEIPRTEFEIRDSWYTFNGIEREGNREPEIGLA